MGLAPREVCPFHHVEMKPIDRGLYYHYVCHMRGCGTEIKNYKPPAVKPGEKKKYAPGK